MTATLMLVSFLILGAPSAKELMDGADARIQQHRTAEAALRVLDADGKTVQPGTELRIEQTNHKFLFGCNIYALGRFKTPEENAAYEKHFAELLNYATLPFYWWSHERAPGEPDLARIEQMVEWCRARNIKVKGHPLAWNFVDPQWIPQDVDTARHLQMARIFREVDHYKGTIDIWDVVNEATAYDRAECRQKSPVLTRVMREQGVGPYLRQAFAMARAANPEATLLINDYREGEDYAFKVVNELMDDQVQPLYDIIGIQSHQHGGAYSVQRLWEICERFARYGKPLHFTENTFVSGKQGWNLAESTPGGKWESTPEGEQRQADDVVRLYTLLFSHPAVEAITWWDFCDTMAWQRAPAGLIRADITPKPAYQKLNELIKDKWWTRTTVMVQEDGSTKFRGFLGDYRVTVGTGDAARSAEFQLVRSGEGPIEVRLK